MTNAVTLYSEPEANFPILKETSDELKQAFEAFKVNLGNRPLSISNLQRMKMPSGGSTTWSFPTLAGYEDRKEIEVVLVGQGTPQVYWSQEFGKGERGAPPDCTSPDGVLGVGLYGVNGAKGAEGVGGRPRRIVGDCTMCPMNQWPARGEAKRSKPCSALRNLFFMTQGEDSILPRYVRVTPGSLKVIEDFMVALGGRRIPYFGAVIKLSLTKQNNRSGIPYAQIRLDFIGKLSVEDTRKMSIIAQSVAHLLGETSDIQSQADVAGDMDPNTVEGKYQTVD